jgi:hypothetical protein
MVVPGFPFFSPCSIILPSSMIMILSDMAFTYDKYFEVKKMYGLNFRKYATTWFISQAP